MAAFNITFDDRAVKAYLSQLPDRLANKATVRALNKVAGNVRTAASKAIRQRRALSARVVRDAMAIGRATKAAPVSTLSVTGRPIPLREYKAHDIKPRGVSVIVTPGKRKVLPHAFTLERFGGHVYMRTSKARLPIKKLFGPSLPSTFVQDSVKTAWMSVAQEAMVKRMVEEVNFELSKPQ